MKTKASFWDLLYFFYSLHFLSIYLKKDDTGKSNTADINSRIMDQRKRYFYKLVNL